MLLKDLEAPIDAPLTLQDRCDRCGAAAKVRVFMNDSNAELLFCGHHMRKFEPSLVSVATFDPEWDNVSED